MPNCFTLTPKGATEPEKLADIDNKLCAHFGVEPDPEHYYQMWVDIEGLALAMGRDWQWMRENFDPERLPIINWLDEHYTPDAWAEIGRR
jgi:hypothetical protein